MSLALQEFVDPHADLELGPNFPLDNLEATPVNVVSSPETGGKKPIQGPEELKQVLRSILEKCLDLSQRKLAEGLKNHTNPSTAEKFVASVLTIATQARQGLLETANIEVSFTDKEVELQLSEHQEYAKIILFCHKIVDLLKRAQEIKQSTESDLSRLRRDVRNLRATVPADQARLSALKSVKPGGKKKTKLAREEAEKIELERSLAVDKQKLRNSGPKIKSKQRAAKDLGEAIEAFFSTQIGNPEDLNKAAKQLIRALKQSGFTKAEEIAFGKIDLRELSQLKTPYKLQAIIRRSKPATQDKVSNQGYLSGLAAVAALLALTVMLVRNNDVEVDPRVIKTPVVSAKAMEELGPTAAEIIAQRDRMLAECEEMGVSGNIACSFALEDKMAKASPEFYYQKVLNLAIKQAKSYIMTSLRERLPNQYAKIAVFVGLNEGDERYTVIDESIPVKIVTKKLHSLRLNEPVVVDENMAFETDKSGNPKRATSTRSLDASQKVTLEISLPGFEEPELLDIFVPLGVDISMERND